MQHCQRSTHKKSRTPSWVSCTYYKISYCTTLGVEKRVTVRLGLDRVPIPFFDRDVKKGAIYRGVLEWKCVEVETRNIETFENI